MPNFRVIGGDGRQYGPISETELRQWMAEGRLNAQSLAQIEGETDWKALGTFPQFADDLRAQAGTLPPLPGTPEDKALWTREVLNRDPEVRIGECLVSGWKFFASNPAFVFGSVCIVWFLNAVMAFIPFIGGLLHLLLSGVLMAGLYLACLRKMRGQPARVGDVFEGFRTCFAQLLLAGAISKVLIQLGLVFCVLPGIYLLVAWAFALPLVVDKRQEFWSAMEMSRKVVTRAWFPIALLLLIVFLPYIGLQLLLAKKAVAAALEVLREVHLDPQKLIAWLGRHQAGLAKKLFLWAGVVQVMLFFDLLFAVGAILRAYENLFGARKS